MPNYETKNDSIFAFEPLFLSDEDARPAMVVVIKASIDIGQDGRLMLPRQQDPINLAPVYWGVEGGSSLKFESETALTKLGTDIILIGTATPPQVGMRSFDVGLRVGVTTKTVRVFGERYWIKKSGSIISTPAGEAKPTLLQYESAFGGWATGAELDGNGRYEPRNPVGKGFGGVFPNDVDRIELPLIEDPRDLINTFGDSRAPAGFGFIAPNWEPRAALAGTYDEEWEKHRKPMLAMDFNRKFYNAASSGLTTMQCLDCAERVTIINAGPVPRLDFELPRIPSPICEVKLKQDEALELNTVLDTLIVDTGTMKLNLIWRANLALRSGPHDIDAIHLKSSYAPARRKLQSVR